MDKKNLKKKRKSHQNKHFKHTDKENVNTSRISNRPNFNPTLNVVQANPSCMETDGETVIRLEDWNLFANEYYKRKRSTEGLSVDNFMTDITNETYWQNLSENDRKALASALSENRDLHNRITQLEDENVRLKALLDEARSLVEVLTELLEEEGDESLDEGERSDDSLWDDL